MVLSQLDATFESDPNAIHAPPQALDPFFVFERLHAWTFTTLSMGFHLHLVPPYKDKHCKKLLLHIVGKILCVTNPQTTKRLVFGETIGRISL